MPRFCIVAPPNLLEELNKIDLMGNCHLLLAHDVVKKEDQYRALFDPERKNPGDHHQRFVILDNSVIELGNSVDLPMIANAANIVQPTCVVLPDVMHDSGATIVSCRHALIEWPKYKGFKDPNVPYMFVPQGRNLREFTYCAESLHHPQIQYWGIPRNLVKHFGTRRDAIRICRIINPHRRIHLLGFSDDMIDDALCLQQPYVYSIDSAVPLRLKEPIKFAMTTPPRGDWWETAKLHKHVIANLQTVRREWVT
jgi:hypothetical protein